MTISSGAEQAFLDALRDDDPNELYESAPVAYLSMSPRGAITKVNRTFLQWTGYDVEEVVGQKRFLDLLAPGDRIFYETHFATLLRLQGSVREIAVEIVGASGGRLPVLVNGTLKTDANGEPVVARLVLFDARERRAYEQELLAARRRAEESESRALELARTLQASLLPSELIPVDGYDIGAEFRPSGDGTVIGGDFYDLFRDHDGQAEVVLGDVCGKGPAAAVVSALARYTARALSAEDIAPSAVLAGVHRALVQHHPDQFCTALMVRLRAPARGDGGRRRVVVAVAGHHLPLCRRVDGSYEALGEEGSILGILDEVTVHDREAQLASGDVVVLYTDGVTEARGLDGSFYDEDRLRRVLDAYAGATAQKVAHAVVDDVLAFQGGDPRDDIALVVIRPAG